MPWAALADSSCYLMFSAECRITLSPTKRTITWLFSSPHRQALKPTTSSQLAGFPENAGDLLVFHACFHLGVILGGNLAAGCNEEAHRRDGQQRVAERSDRHENSLGNIRLARIIMRMALQVKTAACQIRKLTIQAAQPVGANRSAKGLPKQRIKLTP